MRKIISALLAVVLFLGLAATALPGVSAATGDEIRAAKKIISVVFDDSGSMTKDRWIYASYAMQALTAQLNEQDELYITYMSQAEDVSTTEQDNAADKIRANPVNLKDIPGAVKKIREWNIRGNTPFWSVKIAEKVLKGVKSSDPSDQFWLVVMTDGDFGYSVDIQLEMNNRRNVKMSNGTNMNVVYMAMGDGAKEIKDDRANGLFAEKAADDGEIMAAMGRVSNLISGRMEADSITQVDEYTVSFSSSLPMYSISVLSQGTVATVVKAESREQQLNISRNIGLDAYFPWDMDKNIVGNAAVINKKGNSGDNEVINADTYTITFSEPVDIQNLVIQYEPAIGIHPVITRDGIEITDMSKLALGEKVTIEIIPVIPGTTTPIDPNSLPKGITWKIEHVVDGTVEDSGTGTKLTDVILQAGENILRCTMQIPNFAPTILEIPIRIDPHVYEFGIKVDQPQPLTYYRKTAGEGSEEGTQVTFAITDAGVPLDKPGLEEAGAKLKILNVTCDNSAITEPLDKFGKNLIQCDLKQNDDGTYSLIPRSPLPFTSFLAMAGEYTVTVCLAADETITATGTFTMKPHDCDWCGLPGLIIAILVILYLLYILFIKHKFRGQTVYYEVFKLRNQRGVEDGAQAESKSLSFMSGGLLLPTRACRVRFYGLILEAGSGGTITVLGKSIAKQVYSYKQTSMNPTASLGAIASSMKKTERKVGNDVEKVADDLVLSPTSPIYFRSEEGDTEIWRIYTSQ